MSEGISSIAPIATELSALQVQAHESVQELAHQGQPLAIAKLVQEELEQDPSLANTDKTVEDLAGDGDPAAVAKLKIEDLEQKLAQARAEEMTRQLALNGNPAIAAPLQNDLLPDTSEPTKDIHIDRYG